jgi:glycosyltransferase involved in cell wall biosynthesis
MYRDLRLSVVIPCLNEERGIPHVVAKIPQEVDEILVLDNCSTDRTVEVARSQGPRVRVVQHPRNLGYGGSFIRGMPMAIGDVLITTDGDGTYPVEDCLRVVDVILDRDVDFVSCSRLPLQDPLAMHPRSQVGNAILNLLVNGFYGLGLKDAQSGMWVFRKRILSQLRLETTGMAFSNEIKIEAFRHPHVRAIEVPIRYRERIGQSKLYPFRDGVRMVNYLTRRRLEEARRALLPDPTA